MYIPYLIVSCYKSLETSNMPTASTMQGQDPPS